jgi:hypothetical protein
MAKDNCGKIVSYSKDFDAACPAQKWIGVGHTSVKGI